MKVQYLVSAVGAVDIAKGDIVEVSKAEGKRLIDAAFAIAVDDGKQQSDADEKAAADEAAAKAEAEKLAAAQASGASA
jgi:hypothetical protein